MAESTHVVVVDELPDSIGLFSPQLPGFAFGRSTQAEFTADYQQALKRAGVRGFVEGHRQHFGTMTSGQEFAVRWSTASFTDERRALAQQVIAALEKTDENLLREAEVGPDGVATFVCTVPSDTLGWLVDQMEPGGDVFNICVRADDHDSTLIATTVIATNVAVDWPSFAELGWTRETTMQVLVDEVFAEALPRRVLVGA